MKNLIIVESPAKAKTIEKFVGKEYSVVFSKGHVRDLPTKTLGIEIGDEFTPNYEILPDKKKLIADIKKEADQAEKILLATDDDREGEAISWHLIEAANMDLNKIQRIVFHEITKKAIDKAIQNPRSLDVDLVNAQQARRVLDRLVGFELSPVLWKKVKPQLSAGRVQSVAVKLVIEREREINSFNSTFQYKITGNFGSATNKKLELEADLNKKFDTKEDVLTFMEDCKVATYKVGAIQKSPGKKSPAPPFTTSTLQQETARKLGFSVTKTMVVAQQLYEAGYITYMRTDSVNLSEFALEEIHEEIVNSYGEEYANKRKYLTKTKGAQEAHEAIRPTNIKNHTVPGDAFAKRLYELIWKRTIASQMSDAATEKTTITIPISNREEKFQAVGEVILFQGFLKVYIESRDDEDNEEIKGLLPAVTVDEQLLADMIKATQRYGQPAARYSEASLVKKMEELGIGRPSTYAPTISVIQKRGYVVKETRPGKERDNIVITLKDNEIEEKVKIEKYGTEKDKIFPTDIGMIVNEYLQVNFESIMDYSFTAEVEKQFDDIAEGVTQWQEMLSNFYANFHQSIETAITHSAKAGGERLIGLDPKTNEKIFAKLGKYGPMVQFGEMEEDKKPKYAKLKPTQFLETITLEEALELFKLPRHLESYQEKEVLIGVGRFGPYIKFGEIYVSLPKDEDPLTVEFEKVCLLIDNHLQVLKDREPIDLGTHKELPVQVLVGRYGPYVKYNGKNITLGKNMNPKELTLEGAINLIENGQAKNVIRQFTENENLKVMSGRYGAYITDGTNNFKIPKDRVAEELSLADCEEIVKNTPPTAKKKTVKRKS